MYPQKKPLEGNKQVRTYHTVIPSAKCRPSYKWKDLLASCSDNVGQYQGIKQEGGDYHHASTAVSVKSTVSHPTPCCPTTLLPMGRQDQIRLLSCPQPHHFDGKESSELAENNVLFIVTHIASHLSCMPQTCSKLPLVLCDGLQILTRRQQANNSQSYTPQNRLRFYDQRLHNDGPRHFTSTDV